jgi:hypothetical protein
MPQKIAIRKKALINRRKKYFDISSNFFYPLIEFLKKNTNSVKKMVLTGLYIIQKTIKNTDKATLTKYDRYFQDLVFVDALKKESTQLNHSIHLPQSYFLKKKMLS